MKTIKEICSNSNFYSAVIGVLLGALLSFGVQYYFYSTELTRQRISLRLAILQELEAHEALDAAQKGKGLPGVPAHRLFFDKIYENNASRIGLLTHDEIKTIVLFYTHGNMVSSYLKYVRKQNHRGKISDETVQFIQRQLKALSEAKTKAIEKIKEQTLP